MPWVSAADKCEEKVFVQLGATLLQNESFSKLNGKTQMIYIFMCLEAKGRPTFQFPRARAQKEYGVTHTTLVRAVAELEKAGFIKKVGGGQSTRTATDYAFSYDWKKTI